MVRQPADGRFLRQARGGLDQAEQPRLAVELERGEVEDVLVRGKNGFAVMLSSGSGTLLLCMASKEAKLGLLFLDMRRAVADIKRVL